MSDSGMKGRVKGLLAGTPPGKEAEHAEMPSPGLPDPTAQRQALQVLTLAQRTAEDHVASAHRQADKIVADARGTAEQIVHDAEAQADDLQQEADKTLTDARGSAAQIGREAQAHADETRRSADEVLAGARDQAKEIVKEAQANADELKHQAQQRYQDVVGSLAAKREALQEQIEALEVFDREYRTRLTSFMQNQLRALWVDEPKVTGELDESAPAVPAQRSQ